MRDAEISIHTERRPLAALSLLARKMPPSPRSEWISRLVYFYGDMRGQRAVKLNDVSEVLKLPPSSTIEFDILIALETYFSLLCDSIAIGYLRAQPSEFFVHLSSTPDSEFRLYLESLTSGKEYEEFGILGTNYAFNYSWIAEVASSEDLRAVKDGLRKFSRLWKNAPTLFFSLDPLQQIHHALFPKNLRHITGQFYTPQWLAELLLEDLEWTPDQTLIDPYCGSGVFLVAALRKAHSLGANNSEVIERICGIDLNPTACVATRANIVLTYARCHMSVRETVSPNILSADSLSPAVVKGTSEENLFGPQVPRICIDGNEVELPGFGDPETPTRIRSALSKYGIRLEAWLDANLPLEKPWEGSPKNLSNYDRRVWEQYAVFFLNKAETLITNPPWVGWEYMARPYRSRLSPAWSTYDLFTARGLNAAFLKEDLSTLALVGAWDQYLRHGRKSAVVLRPAAMRSGLTSRGLRRLTTSAVEGVPLELQLVREFRGARIFQDAIAEVATWKIRKGSETKFPVKAIEWSKANSGRRSEPTPNLADVKSRVQEKNKIVIRTNEADVESRWALIDPNSLGAIASLQGTNLYTARMGIFTGGANGVFYVSIAEQDRSDQTAVFQNLIQRSRRKVPSVRVRLEKNIVYTVLRGRDIKMWRYQPTVKILCPHTEDSRLYPLTPEVMSKSYPLAFDYLQSMKSVLETRKGFAGWEKKIHQDTFYALQRIGDYSFSPYKVCWKYISHEFTVCVVEPDADGKPILPNDKVVFVAFDEPEKAYFLGGLLSACAVREYINSIAMSRQISVNIIESLALPQFNASDEKHRLIAESCRQGHMAEATRQTEDAIAAQEAIDHTVNDIFTIE